MLPAADEPDVRDVLIVGAGPAGLWAAFQLGIHGIRATIIEARKEWGGQCAALYADKPIFDVPGFASIDAGDLVARLAEQTARFQPRVMFGEVCTSIARTDDCFSVETASGQMLLASEVILATGLGSLGEGKLPPLALPPDTEAQAGRLTVTLDNYQTGCSGLFAIGDAAEYPGKLCLLVSAWHEAALAAFAIRRRRTGKDRAVLGYTSTTRSVRTLFTGE